VQNENHHEEGKLWLFAKC